MENSALEKEKNRTRWCNIRLTESEYTKLKEKQASTTCRQISDYVRRVIFEKPVTIKQRNQSLDDFMNVLISLKGELNALGNNFNQVVKIINSVKSDSEIISWVSIAEGLQQELLLEVKSIQARINQFSDMWLQK